MPTPPINDSGFFGYILPQKKAANPKWQTVVPLTAPTIVHYPNTFCPQCIKHNEVRLFFTHTRILNMYNILDNAYN
jgi:hypothetical protein